jgi:hypothetical protein
MATSSIRRTEQNSPHLVNERIRWQTEASLRRALEGGRGAIDARLAELEQEWDTERLLQALAAGFTLSGIVLGSTVNRRWYALPGVVAAFLLQHAIQGWCPPLPLIRALGVRTPLEIEEERFALKVARGDFGRVRAETLDASHPRTLLAAAKL